MLPVLPEEWRALLNDELQKPYFSELLHKLERSYQETRCYPPQEQLFKAFEHCAPGDVKVVILGQDPYHGEGQAHGLCFSVPDGVAHPPSLRNIFRELEEDIGREYPASGNLTPWAKQGVLLLNTLLSVEEARPNSHKSLGWERFTNAVISALSDSRKGVIFMLWGSHARKKKKLIDPVSHHILEAGHPSPLSANRGYWFGNGHFSKANQLLRLKGESPIHW